MAWTAQTAWLAKGGCHFDAIIVCSVWAVADEAMGPGRSPRQRAARGPQALLRMREVDHGHRIDGLP